MKIKEHKGFTLIELLVVISIIGVLSSVVLAALGSARSSSLNTSIKSNLNNSRAAAEIWYDDVTTGNGTYSGLCQNATFQKFVNAAHASSKATNISYLTAGAGNQTNTTLSVCHSAAGGWAESVPLKVPEGSGGTLLYWCVDWTGTAAAKINPIGTLTTCPAT